MNSQDFWNDIERSRKPDKELRTKQTGIKTGF